MWMGNRIADVDLWEILKTTITIADHTHYHRYSLCPIQPSSILLDNTKVKENLSFLVLMMNLPSYSYVASLSTNAGFPAECLSAKREAIACDSLGTQG